MLVAEGRWSYFHACFFFSLKLLMCFHFFFMCVHVWSQYTSTLYLINQHLCHKECFIKLPIYNLSIWPMLTLSWPLSVMQEYSRRVRENEVRDLSQLVLWVKRRSWKLIPSSCHPILTTSDFSVFFFFFSWKNACYYNISVLRGSIHHKFLWG